MKTTHYILEVGTNRGIEPNKYRSARVAFMYGTRFQVYIHAATTLYGAHGSITFGRRNRLLISVGS